MIFYNFDILILLICIFCYLFHSPLSPFVPFQHLEELSWLTNSICGRENCPWHVVQWAYGVRAKNICIKCLVAQVMLIPLLVLYPKKKWTSCKCVVHSTMVWIKNWSIQHRRTDGLKDRRTKDRDRDNAATCFGCWCVHVAHLCGVLGGLGPSYIWFMPTRTKNLIKLCTCVFFSSFPSFFCHSIQLCCVFVNFFLLI